MAETTKISWADATVNWWIGCTKVSAACDFCYAEAFAKRTGRAVWGHGAPRSRCTGAPALARKLNRKAATEGRRLKVFTNSLSDFFDDEVSEGWRCEALEIMEECENVDWLVLTKRPKIAHEFLQAWGRPTDNLWLGTTAEDQKMYDLRWPWIKNAPAAVRFVSYEPALAPLDYVWGKPDWIIVGGESGPRARPFDLAWARDVRNQCRASGVAYFFKQGGSRPVLNGDRFITRDRSGADIREFPRDLQIQEFPQQESAR